MRTKLSVIIFVVLHLSCNERITIEKDYYPNGQLKYENETINGLAHGNAKSYYENGNLKFEGEFEQDFRIGKHTLYFENPPNKPKEVTYYEWKEDVSRLNSIQFFNEKGKKTFESLYNPDKKLSIEQLECCKDDSVVFRITLTNPTNEFIYARVGELDASFDFVASNRTVDGDSSKVVIQEKCKEAIEGMLFDWKIEFTSDTTGVTRAEHTYFRFIPNCHSISS